MHYMYGKSEMRKKACHISILIKQAFAKVEIRVHYLINVLTCK